jgi:hypothetical protein
MMRGRSPGALLVGVMTVCCAGRKYPLFHGFFPCPQLTLGRRLFNLVRGYNKEEPACRARLHG